MSQQIGRSHGFGFGFGFGFRFGFLFLFATALALSGCADEPTGSDNDVNAVDADAASGPATLRVITFNVMCSTACEKKDTHDLWKDRLPFQQELLKEYDADIVGLQELMPKELALHTPAGDGDEPGAYMAKHPEYIALYWQATEADAQFSTYPDATILLRKSRFSVLSEGSYWLGPEPDKPLSGGYRKTPTLPRVVMWAEVKDKVTGATMYVANSHFDPNSPSQEISAVEMMKRLPEDKDTRRHAIITGDFNVAPKRDAFKTLTAAQADGVQFGESHDLAAKTAVVHNDATEPAYDPAERIDHIFVGPAWSVTQWRVDMRRFGPNNRYPSDHFLIVSDMEAKP